MSRSCYSDDLDPQQLNVWRGAVASAIRGKRGQALLREMLAALDALPSKRLVAGELVTEEGECCALGAVALARGQDVSGVLVDDPPSVASAFGIAHALAAEIEYENDGDYRYLPETPEERFVRMRAWVVSHIAEQKP